MEFLLRHYFSLGLILLFSFWLIVQRAVRDKELRYFWVTVVSCFLLVFQDHLESLSSINPDLRTWRILFSVIGYTLRSVAIAGLVFVVCKPEQRRLYIWAPCILVFLVCSTAFFTDIVFGYDSNYEFYRGPLGYIPFIVPILYLVAILWLTFKRFSDSGGKVRQLILIPCALLCLLSSALDSYYGGVRLHEAMMISSIFYYIFLRSYDVRRDSLTLLLNRQSMYEDCRSLDKTFSASASLDMNGLKVLNDHRGHGTGDAALKKIGEIILEESDPNMRPYRIGGDEFVILYTGKDEITVRESLDRIRSKIKAAGLSISIGYVMRDGHEDAESMIRRSDLKMFEHKAQYYKDERHDRRKARREKTEGSPGAAVIRKLEDSPQPAAVYRFAGHRVETLAVSDGFCRLFGYPDRDHAIFVLDHEMFEDTHPDDRERLSGAILRFSEGKEDLDVVYRTRAGIDSGFRVIHARGSHIHTGTDERVAYVWYMDEGAYIEDSENAGNQISQALNRALHEESILHATHFDELTGLATLAWFFQLGEANKARILSENKQASLLYMDLNGMKLFNHRYGFAEGDRLLKAFAEVICGIFGKEYCCHIAADRFAALSSGSDPEALVLQLFREASEMNGGRTLPVRVGIYSSGVDDVPVSSAFDRAKMACDAITRSSTSAFNFYNEKLQDEARRNQYLAENIDKAVKERWIRPYYQKIVRGSDGVLCDEEALARWIDPVEGFLSPADFIPQLEKTGLIYKLDLCVLDQVLEKIRVLEKKGQVPVPQSINLSRSDFDACDIVREIRDRVDAAGVSRSLITIEITESIIGGDFNFMKEQIIRFRELGFAVWMDDFGSGYSSLDVLQSIPFDLIKFDMGFMRKLDESERGRIILTEMTHMARSLQVDTVCEGVETEDQVSFLRRIGCSKLQGYYFAKPAPFDPENISPDTPSPEAANNPALSEES